MSAIAGIWHLDGSPGAANACRIMLQELKSLGTDRSALAEDGPFCMGSHLLRMLPEDKWDDQPLCLKDGKGWLIADARIDNRETLAKALDLTGKLADSDIVLAAWERWGEDSVKHLIGAFSFAVWQPDSQRLFVARDPVGERPLYFCHKSRFFAFASMPKALLTLPGVDGSLDEEMLARTLGIVPLPDGMTHFRNLRFVPQGHCITITPGGTTQRRYWHPGDTPRLHLRTDEEYVEAFRDCFDEAVRCRLRSTGAIGSELSSGLDSSSVTATAAMLLSKSGGGLTAFTQVPRAGFQAPVTSHRFGDEGPFAAEVAAMYPNIEHVLVPNGTIPMMECVQRHVELDDEPLFNPTNNVWIDAIRDQARERGITTLLNGRAGNGTISYDGFLWLSDLFRSGHWLKLLKTTLALRRNGFATFRNVGGVTLLPMLPIALQEFIAPRIGEFDLDYCAVNPDLARRTGLLELARFHQNLACNGVQDELNQLFLLAEWGNDNAGVLAGWGIELRDPTADQRVFEFIHSLPCDQFVRDGWMRCVVRRGMKGRLPDSTLHRFARGMQSSDWHLMMEDSLPAIRLELKQLQRSPLACRVLDLPRLERLAETWPSGGFDTREVLEPYHYAFSRALGMGPFLRRHDPDFKPSDEC